MARYIDADKLIENLKKQYGEDLGWQCTVNMSDIGMMIEDTPTADVQEVRHGIWVTVDDGVAIGDGTHMECSECGTWKQDRYKSSFCPHCGADMRGDK